MKKVNTLKNLERCTNSDDEDTFVKIGTPLDPYEEDEAPKKPVHTQDQAVRDSRGRQRFHGAFTGGFSAGYYNTVGSKDGWKPSTFVSSKSQRAGKVDSQRPEYFMDDEDLSEHGIAPRTVSTKDVFVERKRKNEHSFEDRIIPGDNILDNLSVPAILPIGIKLLRKLGWKEGQGIGPRVQKRKKNRHADIQRMYGCALPASVESEESDDSDIIEGLTFAPKDTNPVNFTPKDNVHGIGYSGIRMGSSGHINLFEEPRARSSAGKVGFRGQAFGVGALEDEDDSDIYATESMSKYDRALAPDDNKMHGWTAPKHMYSKQRDDTVDKLRATLDGFKIASAKSTPKKLYPPPVLPKNFKPSRRNRLQPQNVVTHTVVDSKGKKLNASERAEMLGETPHLKSVFELVPKEDQCKIEAAKMQAQVNAQSTQPTSNIAHAASATQGTPLTSSTTVMDGTQATNTAPTSTTRDTQSTFTPGSTIPKFGTNFQPFASNPEKQKRYEHYLEVTKQGRKYTGNSDSHMTEWDASREIEEFRRAAALYRPLSNLMASRFTSAKFKDTDDKVEMPPDEGMMTDQKKAAQLKMYGKMTRDRFEWHPHALLCKRFNIPNPYPDSQTVGVPKVKRDKFSVFNFLGTPTEMQSKTEEATPVESDNQAQTKKKKSDFKPLAILATVDLTPKPRVPTKSNEGDAQAEGDRVPTGNDGAAETIAEQSGKDTPKEGERPPMDLFKAIFADSESSDSSSDSDHEKEEPAEIPEPSNLENIKSEPSVSLSTNKGVDSYTPNVIEPAVNVKTELVAGVNMDARTDNVKHIFRSSSSKRTSRWNSDNDDANCDDKTEVHNFIETSMEADVNKQSADVNKQADDRLGHEAMGVADDNEGYYGPSLPPPLAESIPEKSYPDKESRNKERHKHKDAKKHKRKKKKSKSKKKKSRHYSSESDSEDSDRETSRSKSKHKKKKKRKKEKVIEVSSESSSEEERPSRNKNLKKSRNSRSSASGSDVEVEYVPSNKELLNKIHQISSNQSKRASAKDFWS